MLQQYTSIVTAGSPVLPAYAEHPNYPTIQAAMSASLTGGLVIVMPGVYISATHNSTVNFSGKNLTIAGAGLTPDEVQLRMHETNRYGWFGIGGETVLIENLHIHRPAAADIELRNFNVFTDNPATLGLNLRFHRVRFSAEVPNLYGMYYGGTRYQDAYYDTPVRFSYCQLDRPPGDGRQTRWTPRSKTRFEHCYCPGGFAEYQNRDGAWALLDIVTTPTAGYGPLAGLPVTRWLGVPVQGTARHAGQASVRVVVFLWDTTWWHTTPPLAADGSWTAYIPPGHAYGVYYTGFDGSTTPRVEGPYPPVAA